MSKIGKNVDRDTVSNETLLQPSIFDTDQIKELKIFLQEIMHKVQETKD